MPFRAVVIITGMVAGALSGYSATHIGYAVISLLRGNLRSISS